MKFFKPSAADGLPSAGALPSFSWEVVHLSAVPLRQFYPLLQDVESSGPSCSSDILRSLICVDVLMIDVLMFITSFVWLSHPLISIECMNLFRGSCLYGIETTNHGVWGLSLYRRIGGFFAAATQPLSHSASTARSASQSLCFSGWVAERLWAMGWCFSCHYIMKRIPACMLLINWLGSLSIGGCYHVWWFRFQTIIGVMIPDWFTFFELQPPTRSRYIDHSCHWPVSRNCPWQQTPYFLGNHMYDFPIPLHTL